MSSVIMNFSHNKMYILSSPCDGTLGVWSAALTADSGVLIG